MFVAPMRFQVHQQRTYVKNRGATLEDQLDPTIELEEDLATSFPHGMGTPAMLVTILGITDDAKGSAMVRPLRWPRGVRCPHCDSAQVVKQGRDETQGLFILQNPCNSLAIRRISPPSVSGSRPF